MCDCRRLNDLKRRSVEITDRINKCAPLSMLVPQYVSPSGLTFSDFDEKLKKISDCASIVEMKESWLPGIDGVVEQSLSVSAANYCKQHTICPICADRMQARRRARYSDPIKNQSKMVLEGRRYAYILTYTIADGPDLSERLELLKKAKRAFRRMGQRRGHVKSRGEAGKIRAAISTIEVKRGAGSGLWHTHIHELVFSDRPLNYRVYDEEKRKKLKDRYGASIPKDELNKIALRRALYRGEEVAVSKISQEWMIATDGDSIGIDVERMEHVPRSKIKFINGKMCRVSISSKIQKKLSRMSFEDSIAYQAKEVLKYITDLNENNPFDSVEILDKTYNKRMVATYGEFRGILGDDYNDPPADDQVTYVLAWWNGEYGSPIPGTIRDFEGDQIEHDTRSACGKVTGEYRRQRRAIIRSRGLYGSDLHRMLDDAKRIYRSRINAMWSLYRQHKSAEKRLESANCDKYSSLLATQGMYVPGSTSSTLYDLAFHD